MTRARHFAKWLGLTAIGLAALAVVLAAVGYGALQSEGGRHWAARTLERLVSTPGELEVRIGRLAGHIPFAFSLDEVRVADRGGDWLAVEAIEVQVAPADLWLRTLRFRRLEAAGVRWERLPAPSREAAPGPDAARWPALPFAVQIDRLKVDEVALGAALLGEAAAFRVKGQAASPDGAEVGGTLSLERSDGRPGSLHAVLRYRSGEDYLEADARVEEPAGGLLVRALGLDGFPALSARLSGRGPLSDWSGKLSLGLEELAEARAELRLERAKGAAFSVAGTLDVSAGLQDLPWRLLRGRSEFEARGSWQAPATLALDRGRIGAPGADLTLAGRADLEAEALTGEVALRIPETLGLQPYLPGAALTGLAATATLDGSLRAPDVSLEAEAGRAVLPGFAADHIATRFTFRADSGFDPDRPHGRVTASGSAGRFDLAAAGDWSPAVGRRLDWSLDAVLDASAGEFREADVLLETERGRLAGQGLFNWRSGATDARLRAAYFSLAPLGPRLGLALDGRLDGTAEVTSAGPFGALDANVAGAVADLVLPDPLAQALATPSLAFRGTLGLPGEGGVTITDLQIESSAAKVTGEATVRPERSEVSADYRAEIADLSVLSAALGQSLAGSAVVTGRGGGRFEALALSGTLEVPAGAIADVPVEALSLSFTAEDVPGRPAGRLQVALGSPLGRLTAGLDYRIGTDALHLNNLSAAASDLEVEGQARIPFSGAPIEGAFDGRLAGLSHWAGLAGLEGDGRGTVRLALAPADGRQSAKLEAELADVRLAVPPEAPLTASAVTAQVEIADLSARRVSAARLEAGGLRLADLDLATLAIDASGGPAGGPFRAAAAGAWRGALRLETAGRVAVEGSRVEVEVSRLAGRALSAELSLNEPVRVAAAGPTIEMSGLDLSHGEARLRASASRAPGRLAADVRLEGLALASLRPLVDLPLAAGRGDAHLRLSGTAAAPTGEVEIGLRQVSVSDLPEVPAFDLALQGRLENGVLASSGRISGLTEDEVVLTFDLPVRLDPDSLVPRVPPDRPLAGALNWQGPVDPLWALVASSAHDLGGQGEIEAALAGTAAAPRLDGRFTLRRGRYENLRTGTLLSDLELDGALAENRIELTRLSAGDGGSGSLNGEGVIVIDQSSGFAGELALRFEAFALLRRDDITAVAHGEMKATGKPDRSRVEGRVETDAVEVYIPDRLPPDVVELGAVEEGAPPPGPDETKAVSAAPGGHRAVFDLAIDIPRRAFIRGRGIDSEWAGRLTLAGAGDEVAITGRLRLVRGRIAALGKTFRLDEGQVTFDGASANDPYLYIVASRDTEDLEVTITASGPLSNPKLAFTSVPDLPEDEIISQVLFGKSTSQLSATEAAQLAASVAQLTGQAGGTDGLLGRVRTTLGIDVLRFESDDSGGSSSPSVAAGKYVTDEVYIGAKQGTEVESGAAEVEVELTPNISIESEVGQEGQSELGVKFKWDY